MKEKSEYIAPLLTVVTFKIDCGFAMSGINQFSLFHQMLEDDEYNFQNQENWYEDNGDFFGTSWGS